MTKKRIFDSAKKTSTSAKASFRIGGGETDVFIRSVFPGESEMARRMRAFDWSKTDLGPPETWPQNLRIALGICLTSRFPSNVLWGTGLTMFYNDSYISFLGEDKHPAALGRSGREAWSEIWDQIGPMIEGVLRDGNARWSEDILMFFDRELPKEEAYGAFSFSPVFGVGGEVEGVFCAFAETTEKIIEERRLDMLRKLGVEAAGARSVAEVCEAAADAMADNPYDIPFAAIYLVDGSGTHAELKSLAGFPQDARPFPSSITVSDGAIFPWSLASMLQSRRAAETCDFTGAGLRLPGSPWPEPASKAVALPIFEAERENLSGLAVLGVSPRRTLDGAYRRFFGLIASHIGAAISDARAYEAELEKSNVEIRVSRRAALNQREDMIGAGEALRVGYVGSVIDITDRKRAEMTLGESEERFRALTNYAPTLIWVNGPTGCEFVNQAYLEFLGVDEGEMRGYDWTQFIHPEDREGYVNAYLEAVSRRDRFEAECRIRRSDGEYRWIQSAGRPRFEGGEFKGYIGASVVIHERKLAETGMAQMAAIVESSSDAIISKDLNGVVTSWNKGAEKLFGYTAAEVIGEPITNLFPQNRLSEEAQILERVRRGEFIEPYESVRRRKDGQEVDISLTVSPIRDKTGKVIGVSKIARDISERKRAEAEMEELLLKESAARAEAEAANHSKDEFIAMVSHELRAPLNSILGYNRMLREKGLDEERLKHCCVVIERNARAQLRLIEDLLDTARIVNGKLRLDARRLDINPVIAAALDTVRPAADTKGVKLRVAVEDEMREESSIHNPRSKNPQSAIVLGDAARLQQIVWNLLSNAIKFTPAGGDVELRVERAGEHIRIVVSDTGKGIQPEFLPYVFDRFRQRDSSSSQRSGGLGLGLALVKRLTELHGGKVEAASEGAGHGATFTVTLPLAEQSELRVSEPPALAVFGANGETRTNGGIIPTELKIEGVRVLVIDDQEEARALLADFLGRCGAVVTTVSSGAEAMTALSNSWGGAHPDVLLCDIAMPEEDGYAALSRVRALEEALGVAASERIPAVALTALTGDEERLRALRAGFHFHVAKPVDPLELTLLIANVTGALRKGAYLQ